ncbi:MAG TPA: HD domain-containing phosphohydrolase [Thermoanaerobaculaceae bacterium]|nr:HD domain-containing phosphohydrolase [Thermoanaerobaculaceae bacterium]
MPPAWDAERERRAKELLYRCMEELQATKAALYLEGADGEFTLATSYGFGRRDKLPESLAIGHPLLDWVRRRRTAPTYLNESEELPALHAHLEGAGTSRLLTIPITVADRLVGLVDVRDRSRKARFGPEDVTIAKSIRLALERFLMETGAYGEVPPAARETGAPVAPPPPPAAPALPHRWAVEELTGLVRSLARLPDVAAAAVTVTDGASTRVLALRASPLDQQHREGLTTHQARALLGAGVRMPPPERWGWDEQSSGGTQTRQEEIRTAVLLTGPPVWIALSLVTPAGSTSGDPIFAAALHHLELASALRDYRRATRNLARILLEPGETAYPHLRQHSQTTSEIAQRVAAALRLTPDHEELVTVAAYLHDVGLRELEYSRVYRMERPGEAERRLYQRHPVVGARIVEAAEFPGDLAGAIRHHHERWDGTGYPQRLAGNLIPLPSRIIHLAEVYDVLTSPSSYRRQMPRDAALDAIRAEAGRQFDPDLVPVLAEVVRQ